MSEARQTTAPDGPGDDETTARRIRRRQRMERQARLRREKEIAAADPQPTTESPPVPKPPPAAKPPAPPIAKVVPGVVEAETGAAPAPYEAARVAREGRMREIRGELRRRRRRRLAGILLRFLLFVMLPTAAVGWYYFQKATDMYVSRSALIFKSGTGGAGFASLLSFGGLGNLTDSVSVQEYILSKDILRRLDREHGYFAHFQDERIDPAHRLAPDANIDSGHKYYVGGLLRPGKVAVGFDAAEGLIRLEVIAATPEAARRFSEAIIAYSEEKVNELNERRQNDGVRFAEGKVAEARAELLAAQRRVAEAQERVNVYSVEAEAGALQTRIAALEAEIDGVLGRIEKLKTVARNPDDSRYAPLRLDLEVKTGQLSELRARLTGGSASAGPSMAALSSELEIARVEQATANLMYSSALSSLETAVATATSQSLYLETVVRPGLPAEATRPKRLTNTALVFLVLFAGYLLAVLTISTIREQAAI